MNVAAIQHPVTLKLRGASLLVIVTLLALLAGTASAQPTPPPDIDMPAVGTEPPIVSNDGDGEILLVVAAALAIIGSGAPAMKRR